MKAKDQYPRVVGFLFPKYNSQTNSDTKHRLFSKLCCILLILANLLVLLLGSVTSMIGLIYTLACLRIHYQPFSQLRYVQYIRWCHTSIILLIISIVGLIVFTMTLKLLMMSGPSFWFGSTY